MSKDLRKEIKASPAQLHYANTLFYGAVLGFVIMLITYCLYIFGIVEPQIPLEELPKLWTGSAEHYRAVGHIPQGWDWLSLVGKGDICNFLGIVLLASLTVICFLQLAWNLFRHGQKLMGFIAVAEVIVLTVAASGVLVSGAH